MLKKQRDSVVVHQGFISVLQSYSRFCSEMLLFFSQYALHVYNEVMSVGQKYGIRNAGYYALRSLRIEKFFAFWGQDLDSFTTPLECGREFRVKFDKVSFFISSDPECSNNHIIRRERALRTLHRPAEQ